MPSVTCPAPVGHVPVLGQLRELCGVHGICLNGQVLGLPEPLIGGVSAALL